MMARVSGVRMGLELGVTGRRALGAELSAALDARAAEGSLSLTLQDLGDRVWVARRIDIARHWLATQPPQPGVADIPTT